MAVSTATALIGSALLGAAGTGYSAIQQRKDAKEQERRMREQEKAAKERAALSAARDETGADIQLGRQGVTTTPTSGAAGTGGATNRAGAVGARVGGLPKPKNSRRVGL